MDGNLLQNLQDMLQINMTVTEEDEAIAELAKVIAQSTRMEFNIYGLKNKYHAILKLNEINLEMIMKAYKVLDNIFQLMRASYPWDFHARQHIECDRKIFYYLIPHRNEQHNSLNLINISNFVTEKRKFLDDLLNLRITSKDAFQIPERLAAKKTKRSKEVKKLPRCQEGSLGSFFKEIKVEVAVVKPKTAEYCMIKKYMKNSHSEVHSKFSLELEQIFTIRREEDERKYRKQFPNKMLLWHGSKSSRFAGILCDGLRVAPDILDTENMFGNGLYFADRVSKAAQYCEADKEQSGVGLLLLCEVALGKMYKVETSFGGKYEKPPSSYQSIKGVGQNVPSETIRWSASKNKQMNNLHEEDLDCICVPLGGTVRMGSGDTSLVHNEYVIYDPNQVQIRYLVQSKFHFKGSLSKPSD